MTPPPPPLLHLALLLLCWTSAALAWWSWDQFQHLIVFGDSYSDQGRFLYIAGHHGAYPPPGVQPPTILPGAAGGRPWPMYVEQYLREKRHWITVNNYATNGAACSNEITPRSLFPPWLPAFPSLREYQVPAFIADYKSGVGEQVVLKQQLRAYNAVYAIFIGTNDMGVNSFINDRQVPGKTLADYMDCVFEQVKVLYRAGARHFVIFNLIPLHTAPLYASAEAHGSLRSDNYWQQKPENTTEIADKMKYNVDLVNAVFRQKARQAGLMDPEINAAFLALFDVERLFLDIYQNPAKFLNGTDMPYNTTDYAHRWDGEKSPDSFMWFDELHPTEQVERHIAKNFVEILNGKNEYTTFY